MASDAPERVAAMSDPWCLEPVNGAIIGLGDGRRGPGEAVTDTKAESDAERCKAFTVEKT